MYNPKFYETYQNTVVPQDTNFNPYADQYFGKNDTTPYMQGVTNNALPQNMMQNRPYPLQSSTDTPYLNTPTYAKGGKVRRKGGSYRALAETLRRQGQGQDQILAHINPQEAYMLQQMSGGDINPITGLPQFGLFNNPGKWLKSVAGPAAGAIIGNMILPGIGGIIGGALGGAAGSAVRGRKDYLQAGVRGAAIGAGLPSAASAGAHVLSKVGAQNAANYLSNYGTQNAILPSLGLGSSGSISGMSGGETATNEAVKQAANTATQKAATTAASEVAAESNPGFWATLGNNTKDYLSKPSNLISIGSSIAKAIDRPKKEKEKTAEEKAEEQKRVDRILRTLTPEERAEKEAQLLAEAQMKRRIERQQFLPEERLGDIPPLYLRSNTPAEYGAQGKWLNYYDNPEFTGTPIPYKKGGAVEPEFFEEFLESYPSGLIQGMGGGQDDDRHVGLPKNAYIVDASTTSDLGDGNSEAGANKIHALISSREFYVAPKDVKKLGKGDINKGVKVLDNLQKNVRKHKRGGKVSLPPKAKPINSYIKGAK